MTGSLTVKNGKYYAVLNIYENGKRKKKWICSELPEKGNKRKAEQFLREKLAEYERMEGIVKTDTLFADYVLIWAEQKAKAVDKITVQGYNSYITSHIVPWFRKMGVLLREMNHAVIQRYVDEKTSQGRLDGKGGLSPKSIRLHMNVITQVLDMAVKKNLLPSNPCRFVVLPQKVRHHGQFYNERQLQDLYAALQDEPILPLVKITALYGLRRSELLGLQWDSIDFEAKTMTIQHTVVKVTELVAKDKTKNASSYRTFPLTEEALSIFSKAKEAETQNRYLCGNAYHESPYVFKWPDGRPYSPDYISHRFHDLLIKHNLPHIRFHELRHSCASMLIALGFGLKDVQEWLGHADIQTTANIYSHLDIVRKNNIASSLQEKLKTL